MKRHMLLGVLGVIAIAGYATAATAKTVDMKIGYATVHDPQDAMAHEIARRINSHKDMGIHVRVFPAGELGIIPRMIEGMELGTLEGMITPPGFLIGINKAFEVVDAPGLFDSVAHAERAFNYPEFYDKYSKLADSKGIQMDALNITGGPTSWASKTPIRKLSDFRGLKVRVLATKIETDIAAAVGSTGVPMPYTEVLPALQRGTIDAVRSAIIVMDPSKFYTVTKYLTDVRSGMIPSATLVSEAWLKRLSQKQRKFVETTLHGITHWGYEKSNEMRKEATQDWKNNGAEVIHLSAADHKKFMDLVRPLGDKVLGTDPATKDMYERLKKAVVATAR